jgi:hypothetical protein
MSLALAAGLIMSLAVPHWAPEGLSRLNPVHTTERQDQFLELPQ